MANNDKGKYEKKLEQLGFSSEFSKSIQTGADIFETVSGVAGYVGTAYSIGEKLGLWGGGPSPLDQMMEAIAKLGSFINQGFGEILKGEELLAMQQQTDTLTILTSPALKSLELLKLKADENLTEEDKKKLKTDTSCTIYYDMPSNIWDIPYISRSAYTDPWSGEMMPPLIGNKVHAFAIVLPIYLHAIAIWLTAITVAYGGQEFKNNPGIKEETLRHADQLAWAHNDICNAIIGLRPPKVVEMVRLRDDVVSPVPRCPCFWENHGACEIGAVELYSTTASVSHFDREQNTFFHEMDLHLMQYSIHCVINEKGGEGLNDYKDDPGVKEFAKATYPMFRSWHAALTLREQKVVYNSLGLGEVWRAMNHLRVLAGEHSLPLADPQTDKELIAHGVWSLREFADRIARAWQQAGGTPVDLSTVPISVRSCWVLGGWPVGIFGTAVTEVGTVTFSAAEPVPVLGAAEVSLRQVLLGEAGRVP